MIHGNDTKKRKKILFELEEFLAFFVDKEIADLLLLANFLAI